MEKTIQQLISIADSLDCCSKTRLANVIDDFVKNRSLQKVAQYVGAIGYVLKQNRAIANCIRKKRVASDDSMQNVILSCLQEYQDGQQYGNNEWTKKYSQLVQQCPNDFDSAHITFLKQIASANDIPEHFNKMADVQKILKENGIENKYIDGVLADWSQIQNLMREGENHYPFKVAAPPSSRGFWSRLFSPSWTRRGKDKDTQYEMDKILESLMDINQQSQQITSELTRLYHNSRFLDNPVIIKEIGYLSDANWDETISHLQNIQSSIEHSKSDTSGIREITDNILSSMNHIYILISDLQYNMNNLRQREAITGRGTNSSASSEFGDLSQALDRLYANPLDKKSLYYAQKMHGRLEDALNERINAPDVNFQTWLEGEEPHRTRVPIFNRTQETNQEGQNPIDSIVNNLVSISDPPTLAAFIQALDDVDKGSSLGNPEAYDALRAVLTKLKQKSQENRSESPTSISGEDFDMSGYLDSADWERTSPPPVSGALLKSNLLKMAEEMSYIDSELTELIKRYLDENFINDSILFPEKACILKE